MFENFFGDCFRGKNVTGIIPVTLKYKCLTAFTLHAFHPKALNDC
jgi:hypothetical protein